VFSEALAGLQEGSGGKCHKASGVDCAGFAV
jgi:hypothetical protein